MGEKYSGVWECVLGKMNLSRKRGLRQEIEAVLLGPCCQEQSFALRAAVGQMVLAMVGTVLDSALPQAGHGQLAPGGKVSGPCRLLMTLRAVP